MSRSLIALFFLLFTQFVHAADLLPAQFGTFRKTAANPAAPPNPAVFKEFGFVAGETAAYQGPHRAKGTVTAYQMQDTTGALAAWEWLRTPEAKRCTFQDYCAQQNGQVLVFSANYVLDFEGITPDKPVMDLLTAALPNRHASDLPPVLSFVPLKDLTPNSARYILGPESLRAVAPELVSANPGFEQSAEAHYSAYRADAGTVKLVLFDYPSPEMARLHTRDFKGVSGAQVKRSGVLVAVILPGASEKQATAVLDQIRYQAKILWNEPPPANPVPRLYRLLINIIILSSILSALGLAAGVAYGLMRLYRRRYGTLEDDEAMTTLHLTGE